MKEVSEIFVEFYKVDAGWLYFTIKTQDQTFDGYFSYVYDPIPDLKSWLEAVAVNPQQTSFSYDPEGGNIIFNYQREYQQDKSFFTISSYSGEIFLKAFVNPKQLVSAIYNALIKFAESDKYIADEWEVYTYKELFLKILKTTDEQELINELAELSGEEFQKIYFKINPTYLMSYPKAKDKNEEINMFLEEVIDDKDIYTKNETPDMIKIPDGYDNWSFEQKKEFVIDCIRTPASPFDGTKLLSVKSDIIDKFISKS